MAEQRAAREPNKRTVLYRKTRRQNIIRSILYYDECSVLSKEHLREEPFILGRLCPANLHVERIRTKLGFSYITKPVQHAKRNVVRDEDISIESSLSIAEPNSTIDVAPTASTVEPYDDDLLVKSYQHCCDRAKGETILVMDERLRNVDYLVANSEKIMDSLLNRNIINRYGCILKLLDFTLTTNQMENIRYFSQEGFNEKLRCLCYEMAYHFEDLRKHEGWFNRIERTLTEAVYKCVVETFLVTPTKVQTDDTMKTMINLLYTLMLSKGIATVSGLRLKKFFFKFEGRYIVQCLIDKALSTIDDAISLLNVALHFLVLDNPPSYSPLMHLGPRVIQRYLEVTPSGEICMNIDGGRDHFFFTAGFPALS